MTRRPATHGQLCIHCMAGEKIDGCPNPGERPGPDFTHTHSHRADPATSRQAAAAVAYSDSMQRTLAVVREHPGLHYEQIEALGGSQQRLSDLHKLGLIDSCGTGRTRRGQSATLWKRAALEQEGEDA